MPLATRRVDLEGDRAEILALLERNLPDIPHATRFEWLYLDNPGGPAFSWVVFDTESGRMLGLASLFPRPVWIGMELALAGQVGDFAVEASHRTLGPALMLQRATFEPVDGGHLVFCYDCPPHEQGMATFRRLGMGPTCRIDRYARPVRVDRRVAEAFPVPILARPLAFAANQLLRLWRARPDRLPGLEVGLHSEEFGEEFSELDRRTRAPGVLRGRRHSEDLNWRYRRHPLHRYRVLTARKDGQLVGYAVVRAAGEIGHVMDLSGIPSPTVALALLEMACQDLARTSIQTIQAVVTEGNPAEETLRNGHFRYRAPAGSVVAYRGRDPQAPAAAIHRERWAFTRAELAA
jgi:hypothetical protein